MDTNDYKTFLEISGVGNSYLEYALNYLAEHVYSLKEGIYNGKERDNREKHLSLMMLNKFIKIMGEGEDAEALLNYWNTFKHIEPQIRGDFHIHTIFSDGMNTVNEIIAEAEEIGYSWIVFSDHSPVKGNTYRLDDEKFSRFVDETGISSDKTSLSVYKSIEADISPEGLLMFPDKWLKDLDFIIVSMHENITDYGKTLKRIETAVKEPEIKVFAHPFYGLEREYNADYIENLLDILEKTDTAVEFNFAPQYVMRNFDLLDRCRGRKVKFVLSTDTHFLYNLYLMRFASAFPDLFQGDFFGRNLNINENTF